MREDAIDHLAAQSKTGVRIEKTFKVLAVEHLRHALVRGQELDQAPLLAGLLHFGDLGRGHHLHVEGDLPVTRGLGHRRRSALD